MGSHHVLECLFTGRRVGLALLGRLGLGIIHGREEFSGRLHDDSTVATRHEATIAGVIHFPARHLEAEALGCEAAAAARSASQKAARYAVVPVFDLERNGRVVEGYSGCLGTQVDGRGLAMDDHMSAGAELDADDGGFGRCLGTWRCGTAGYRVRLSRR